MVQRVRLTDAFVDSSRCVAVDGRPTDYFDQVEGGFSIRVSPGGTKSWSLRYRPIGSKIQRRITLGRYDKSLGPAHVGVADGRLKAKAAKVEVGAGSDPAVDKATKKAEIAAAKTVNQIADEYFSRAPDGRHRVNGKPKGARTLEGERSYFDRLLAPEFGSRKIASLTRREIQDFIDEQTSQSAARQCRVVLQALFNFAVWRDEVSTSPIPFVGAPTFASRERTLTDGELKLIWDALEGANASSDVFVSRGVILAIMLAAATLQRRAEVAGIAKTEVDLASGIWTLPASRTKNRRLHIVPLSGLAMELAREAWALTGESAYLFPSPRSKDEDRPIEAAAISHAWRRICAHHKIENTRPHDLRRTGATNMTGGRLKVPRFIVSRVLNHSGDAAGAAAVTAVYDRFDYFDEKKNALDGWGELLRSITTPAAEDQNAA